MNSEPINTQNSTSLLMIIILSIISLSIVVFLDIPVARQIVGFIYLTFLPGFVFLKLVKLDKLDPLEVVLFSVGASVAFLMIAGLFLDFFATMFGFSRPLSLLPIMLFFNGAILIGGIIAYLKRENETVKTWSLEPIKRYPFVLLYLGLPIVSVIGAMFVNINGSNIILLFMVLLIALLFTLSVFSTRLLPSKLYPVAIFTIALALLFHASLISKYIIPYASDVPGEYFLFYTAQSNAHWSPVLSFLGNIGGRYNNMLSITILPTVYSTILNIDSNLLFKLLYPLLFSFVPVGLYQIWQKYVDKKYAFIAAFLLMVQMTFYNEMLGLNRQIVAELFFVLLLLIISNKSLKPTNIVYFMIFSFALVTSHYALAEIFLFLLAFTVVALIVLKRPSTKITINMVLLFFTIMFAWYIFTSGAITFDSIVETGNNVYLQLGGFFNPASRGETILTGLGLVESPSIWNTLGRGFAYLTQGLIVLGFVGLVTKRSMPHIKREYFIFSVMSVTLLALLLIVPGLARTLNMTRFYHILLFFLAPLCVVGVEFFVKLVLKHENKFVISLLLILVLVPYALFQTNFVYEVTGGDSYSVPFSKYRMDHLRLYAKYGYTDDYSVYGAKWVAQNVNYKNLAELYADDRTQGNVLMIHGPIFASYVHTLTNTTRLNLDNAFIYLSTINVVDEIIPFGKTAYNMSELTFNFDELNLIYTNGFSKVYNKP